MNKAAIRNFAIWARNKLIADIQYRAGLMGITVDGIRPALPQSTKETEFYDIGTAEPYAIMGEAIKQRRNLVDIINQKTSETNYQTAYKYIMEGVAYTWFNRLIAIRFMEINDYLPSHVRVLSSDSGKMEPDLVTTPFDAHLTFSDKEKEEIVLLKNNNNLDECFRMLFIKQCNALNEILPSLFEKTADYTELLLNISAIDKEGVVYHLVNDISEDEFNTEKGGQVEIIGWLYQYYNTEPKNEAFAKSGKIIKEEIPAVTQLFTPDWIVRYMVENSLGRLWVEGHPNDLLKSKWKYYLEEAEQESEVQAKLDEIHKEYAKLNPEDIHFIDPCMGSGHILVYAFDVLMQIYESVGYSQRDAAKSILENNLYGLDIDDRAYQMAYFAVMMKARQYNRRILSAETACHLYSIQESNHINRNQLTYFGAGFNEVEKNDALRQIGGLLDTFRDAKEYGSILHIEDYDWELLRRFVENVNAEGQMTFDTVGLEQTKERLQTLIDIGEIMVRKYEVVVTNPPYMSYKGMNAKLSAYAQKRFPDSKLDLFAIFIERCEAMTKKQCIYSMITQNAFMFLGSFKKLRSAILKNDFVNMLHLGPRAFEEIGGEVVQTASFVVRKKSIDGYKAEYARLVDGESQSKKERMYLSGDNRYVVSKNAFLRLPDSPLSYWANPNAIKSFENDKNLAEISEIVSGMTTGNNDLYLKLWWEVCNHNLAIGCTDISSVDLDKTYWFPYNKGGSYRKWYGNNEYVVDWSKSGKFNRAKTTMTHLYLKKCITWSDISTSAFAARACSEGHFFDVQGSCAFPSDENYLPLLTLLNTKVMTYFALILNPTMHTQVGDIKRVPYKLSPQIGKTNDISEKNVLLAKLEWDSFEVSWDFVGHPLVGGITAGRLIADKYKEWESECDNRFNQLKINEEELNRIFINIYGLQEELAPEIADKDVTVRKADLERDIRSFISYAVGCMFGRYSLDKEGLMFAGGNMKEIYKYYGGTFADTANIRLDGKFTFGELGTPFYYLPVDGKEPLECWKVDADNIILITDEEYFSDDIVCRFVEFVKMTYGVDNLEENLDFIAKALGNKGSTSREIIRNYFVNDFFKDHCATYSVTGSGKRPIYWLFDSGKQNGFKALIYLHRYNADTIGNLRVDYLHRMQRVYESEIERMQDMVDHSTNSREVGAATKRREKLQKQLKECRDYDEKIGHLALSRIELDLDDGVKINYEKVQTAKDGKKYQVLAKI